MAIKTGREGMSTHRDGRIMQALFFCRYLTTNQIALMFFDNNATARRRLWQLKNKGYIVSRSINTVAPTLENAGKKESVWHLSKEAFEMYAYSLGYDEGPGAYKYVPKQLDDKGTRHHIKTNDLYVAAKADLEEYIGDYPDWVWIHEKKAHDAYDYQGRRHKHQPDAHVCFFGHTFIIERQTRESKVKPKDIDDKVRDHALWANKRTDHPDKVEVIFATEDERIAELALEAGKRYSIYVVAGTVDVTADYLYQCALRLAPDDWGGEVIPIR